MGALPGCEDLSHVEDTVEEGEAAGDGSALVLAVEGAEDSGAGNTFGAMVLREEGLGLRVVGVGWGLVVGAAVEKSVEVVADGSLVLRGLLGGGKELGLGDVLVRGTSVLLAGLASLETEVLEVLLVEVAAVVFWVVRGGTMCGTVVFLWVKAVRIKHKSAEDEGKRGGQRRGAESPCTWHVQERQLSVALSHVCQDRGVEFWFLPSGSHLASPQKGQKRTAPNGCLQHASTLCVSTEEDPLWMCVFLQGQGRRTVCPLRRQAGRQAGQAPWETPVPQAIPMAGHTKVLMPKEVGAESKY